MWRWSLLCSYFSNIHAQWFAYMLGTIQQNLHQEHSISINRLYESFPPRCLDGVCAADSLMTLLDTWRTQQRFKRTETGSFCLVVMLHWGIPTVGEYPTVGTFGPDGNTKHICCRILTHFAMKIIWLDSFHWCDLCACCDVMVSSINKEGASQCCNLYQ